MPKKPKKEKLQDKASYEKFVIWCATPSPERQPRTQGELAIEMGIDEGKLSDWKHVEGFYDEVERHMKKWMKGKTPNVIGALYNGILKDKKAAEAKLWLQYGQGWAEKHDVGGEGLEGVFKLEQTLRELFEKRKKKI